MINAYHVVRFKYGLDAGDIARRRKWKTYNDMVDNWSVRIAPAPMPEFEYNSLKNQITNMVSVLQTSRSSLSQDLKKSVQLLKSPTSCTATALREALAVCTLNLYMRFEPDDYSEYVTLTTKKTVTSIDHTLILLTDTEVNTLLNDFNVYSYNMLLDLGKDWLQNALSVTSVYAEDAIRSVFELVYP